MNKQILFAIVCATIVLIIVKTYEYIKTKEKKTAIHVLNNKIDKIINFVEVQKIDIFHDNELSMFCSHLIKLKEVQKDKYYSVKNLKLKDLVIMIDDLEQLIIRIEVYQDILHFEEVVITVPDHIKTTYEYTNVIDKVSLAKKDICNPNKSIDILETKSLQIKLRELNEYIKQWKSV